MWAGLYCAPSHKCVSAALLIYLFLLQVIFYLIYFAQSELCVSFFLSCVILAPVAGNFTEEEANGNTVPQDTLEYPLQRDEVHTQNAKGDRNHQIPSGTL